MEEGVLWRAGVMEGPCTVARGKDINIGCPLARSGLLRYSWV
jgi:hypothetical protein